MCTDYILEAEKLIKSFQIPKSHNPNMWRIKIDGNFICTVSGKTVWKRIGDAKNALRHHIEWKFCHCTSQFIEDMYNILVTSPRLEFVELSS